MTIAWAALVLMASVCAGCASGAARQADQAYIAGAEYLRAGKPEFAIAKYDRAVSLVPDNPDYHLARGVARSHFDDYEHALSDFDRCLELSPNDVSALRHRGETLLAMGRDRDGISDCSRAVRIDPQSPPLASSGRRCPGRPC